MQKTKIFELIDKLDSELMCGTDDDFPHSSLDDAASTLGELNTLLIEMFPDDRTAYLESRLKYSYTKVTDTDIERTED